MARDSNENGNYQSLASVNYYNMTWLVYHEVVTTIEWLETITRLGITIICMSFIVINYCNLHE
jgi:hypothetical protein